MISKQIKTIDTHIRYPLMSLRDIDDILNKKKEKKKRMSICYSYRPMSFLIDHIGPTVDEKCWHAYQS